MKRSRITTSEVLIALRRASLNDAPVRLQHARAALFALPAEEQERIARMICNLVHNVPGLGPVTGFEILIATGDLVVREAAL